jgi:type IV pilus assembly protein PilV
VKCAARQSGVTLIEVLVALLIFSSGLLGTVAIQAESSRLGNDSEDRMRAAMLANELVATMWARRTLALASTDMDAWNARVADTSVAGLPNGAGTLTTSVVNGVNTAAVTITWKSLAHGSARYVTQLAM